MSPGLVLLLLFSVSMTLVLFALILTVGPHSESKKHQLEHFVLCMVTIVPTCVGITALSRWFAVAVGWMP
jgi:hypothetical protein